VAHAYNPSYSRGRAQEEHGSKPAWANSLQYPKIKIYKKKKKRAGEGLKVKALSSNPSTAKINNKRVSNGECMHEVFQKDQFNFYCSSDLF
jgi:hypothetical protein